jgi:hypothetical protein
VKLFQIVVVLVLDVAVGGNGLDFADAPEIPQANFAIYPKP